MSCILCKFEKLLIVEKFKVGDLNDLYEKGFNFRPIEANENAEVTYFQCEKCKLKFFYPQYIGNENLYAQLSKLKWYYVKDKFEFDYAIKLIHENASVLEVGAGEGFFASKLSPSVDYVGLEFNQRAIDLARGKKLNIFRRSIEEVGSEKKFDFALSFQVLEHVSDPHMFIRDQVNALKSKGKLVIAVPSQDSFYYSISNHTLDLPPHHLTRWNSEVFKNMENVFGIKLISVEHETLHPLHYEFYLTHRILSLIHNDFKVIDHSLSYKIKLKISNIVAKIFVPFSKKVFLRTKGAHVIAVFEK